MSWDTSSLYFVAIILIGDNNLKSSCLGNHLGEFLYRGNTVYKILFGINLLHLSGQILCIAMTEFLYGVYTCSLKQLCELRTYAVDADKVGVVCPLEDELV